MATQTKDKRDVLARIGATLIQIQRTELTVNFCIKHVVPKTARPSKDLFTAEGRRPPLGRLIAELHRHVAVPDSFKDTLAEFLDKRNALVHQIEFVPGWTLETENGIAVAHQFLGRLEALDRRVVRVFDGMLKAWMLEHGGAGRDGALLPISEKAFQKVAGL
ncbi:hypothetical protein BH10PSE10_BH10PSE10_02890 [soil metagenome]